MAQNKKIFENIFGENWQNLPPIMQKHYANFPYCEDNYKVSGKMNIYIAPILRPIAPLMEFFGTLIGTSSSNIPTEVRFRSENATNAMWFERIYNFPNGKISKFNSRLAPIGGNEVIEWTKIGIGWHCRFIYEESLVKLQHISYKFKILGNIITIPLELFMGRGYAYETPINENKFAMYMELKHPLFGKIYSYDGWFEFDE